MPRTRCRVAQDCALCPVRIKPGSWIGKDFRTQLWCHVGCLVREMHRRQRIDLALVEA